MKKLETGDRDEIKGREQGNDGPRQLHEARKQYLPCRTPPARHHSPSPSYHRPRRSSHVMIPQFLSSNIICNAQPRPARAHMPYLFSPHLAVAPSVGFSAKQGNLIQASLNLAQAARRWCRSVRGRPDPLLPWVVGCRMGISGMR